MVADLVPAELRGTAYGTYNATLGLLDFPASLIAGLLWQGVGPWSGFGAPAPFLFGAVMALSAAILMILWRPPHSDQVTVRNNDPGTQTVGDQVTLTVERVP